MHEHLNDEPNVRARCPLCGPPLPLDGDREIVIRHLRPSDEARLRSFYDTLSVQDLNLRFFTGAKPDESFFARWAAIEELGGFGIVAELEDDGHRSLVGDAAYSPLKDGDVELGIAVAPAHRGWLGSVLLSSLLTHADERGVANMQAIVKTENQPMRGLAAKRPCAILGHPDWGTVRLTMSTNGSTPSWPPNATKPRVLVETNRSRFMGEDPLRRAGFEVMLCTESDHPERTCPVKNGQPCPLIEGADAVIVDLDPRSELTRELIVAEERVHPDVPRLEGFSSDELPKRRDVRGLVEDVQRLFDE